MGRRLPPGEAERRAAERKRKQWDDVRSGKAYKKYNPNDGLGRGSSEQWQDAADARLNGRLVAAPKLDDDLVLLGLTEMPADEKALGRAYRLASRSAHPDAGGSDAAFTALREAYDRLMEKI
jgi:hypothetical protein